MSTADAWITDKVADYKKDRPRYERYREVLQEILGHARRRYAPHAVVQARAKEVPSFAEKMLLKREEHGDGYWPTDLCGARVIVHTPGEVEAVCDFIRSHFTIDKDNSLDAAERLRAREFGYRSFHYVVELPGKFPTPEVAVMPPANVCGLKAEIQVRTIAQHCWADIGHDRIYKGTLRDRLPKQWDRETGRAAALLETVDEAFARLVEGLRAYESLAGAYMSEAELRGRLDVLRTVWAHGGGQGDEALALKIARVAMALEDWDSVISLFPGPNNQLRSPSLLFCLGLATCQRHHPGRGNYDANKYGAGRELLRRAADEGPDVEARTALADTFLAENKVDEARAEYEKAFRAEPTHARAVGGFVRAKVRKERNLDFVALIRPVLEGAIATCRNQIDVKVNLPEALYSRGEFLMLLGQEDAALADYARAVRLSVRESQVAAARADLECYAGLKDDERAAIDRTGRFLQLGQARFGGDALQEVKDQSASASATGLATPVVMVAKGTADAAATGAGKGHEETLSLALADGRARGTVVSTLRPLQFWTDLLAAGIRPTDVKLLALDASPATFFECLLSGMLGAGVAVLGDAAGEARRLQDAMGDTGQVFLPATESALRSWLWSWLDPVPREQLVVRQSSIDG